MKKIFVMSIFTLIWVNASPACTVWGTIADDQVLIAKNRDYYPGNQKFITMNNSHYKFFGLYGDNQYDGKYTIKMGVNQTGLVVFMTFASTIPSKQRSAKIPYYQVMEKILGNYRSIDAINNDSKTLFKDSTPINYIFADRTKTMICEIGLKQDYQCKNYSKRSDTPVTFAQTNHYILPEMEKYNLTPFINQQTSYVRFNKIDELMQKSIPQLSFAKFIDFSFNTEAGNDNPLAEFDQGYTNTYQDNSIFRTFNSHPDRRNHQAPSSDQGVSTMIVELPRNTQYPVNLYLRIINNIKDSKDPVFTQNVSYTEAITVLDTAINNPGAITYLKKYCQRNINSKSCLNM